MGVQDLPPRRGGSRRTGMPQVPTLFRLNPLPPGTHAEDIGQGVRRDVDAWSRHARAALAASQDGRQGLEEAGCKVEQVATAIAEAAESWTRHIEIKDLPADSLPPAIGRLRHLQSLELKNTECTALPESIGDLAELNKLWLQENPRLTRLPDRITELPRLWSLTATQTPLESLPEEISALTSLTRLQLTGGSYERLPRQLTRMKALMHLHICSSEPAEGGGQGLRTLPEDLGDLQSLRTLTLSRHRNLEAIPASLGSLWGLEKLDISHCPKLRSMPPLDGLTSLQTLNLRANSGLVRLPEGLGLLADLTELQLQNCRNLVALPSDLGNLGKLQKMDLRGCTRLQALPDSLGRLPQSCRILVPQHLEEPLQAIRSNRGRRPAAGPTEERRPAALHRADPQDRPAAAPALRPHPQPAAPRAPLPQWKRSLEPFAGEYGAEQFSQWMDAAWRRNGRLSAEATKKMAQIVAAARESEAFRTKLFQFAAENVHVDRDLETGEIDPYEPPAAYTRVSEVHALLLEHRMSDLQGTTADEARSILGAALAERCRGK
ncbi:MAG TPA: leucine-rich repeat domain-containing protein, partial [Burkholderiaceae bacterium]|nr:leucine-rich repeat domain-containing protein [Burkholderiaceae bacterium]